MTPRLTEVFVVREASVQSLAQRYGVPLKFAEEVNTDSPRHADVLIALTLWVYSEDLNRFVRGTPTYEGELRTAYVSFMDYAGKDVVKLLDRFPKKKSELMALVGDPGRRRSDPLPKYDALHGLVADAMPAKDLSNRALLKLSDGSYWVELQKGEECGDEGTRMQHCGKPQTKDGVLYSLRDKLGKPHVTAEVTPEGEDVPRLIQCKGKQNDAPDRKHWPAVAELCRKLHAVPNTSGGWDETEDGLFDWLDDELSA